MAPELYSKAGLSSQNPALSLLFSLHIFPVRGFISNYSPITVINSGGPQIAVSIWTPDQSSWNIF